MDNTLYRPLTPTESGSHIAITRPISIMASGEANYADFSQTTFVPSGNSTIENLISASSIIAPSGLEFLQNDALSNAKRSRDNAVSGINIFNPYIHYIDDGGMPFKIDFSTQFDEIAEKFNIYSKQYREQIEDESEETSGEESGEEA
jgi:hypothetical protein